MGVGVKEHQEANFRMLLMCKLVPLSPEWKCQVSN